MHALEHTAAPCLPALICDCPRPICKVVRMLCNHLTLSWYDLIKTQPSLTARAPAADRSRGSEGCVRVRCAGHHGAAGGAPAGPAFCTKPTKLRASMRASARAMMVTMLPHYYRQTERQGVTGFVDTSDARVPEVGTWPCAANTLAAVCCDWQTSTFIKFATCR